MIAPDPLTAAVSVLGRLAERGAYLSMPLPGRLVLSPHEAADPDDMKLLKAAYPWLMSTGKAATACDVDHPPLPAVDPLPPLPGHNSDAADADAWAAILALTAPTDGGDPFGLTGAIRFARSMGARLSLTPDGKTHPVLPVGHPEAAAVAAAWFGLRERADRGA